MEKLTEAKKKEWYQWGKEAYKGNARMMRTNNHHPDYDTQEKVESEHDNYCGTSLLSEAHALNLKTRWSYSDEAISEAFQLYKDGYNSSRQWYKKHDEKFKAILEKYSSIFSQAEEVAKKVDVSDLKDGFPCGSVHLYLHRSMQDEELGKALAHFENSTKSPEYKYQLPIKMPTYGQYIGYDERICEKVEKFLRTVGILTSSHRWID